MRRSIILLILLGLRCAPPVRAQSSLEPEVDTGLAPGGTFQDADLVVVRERVYGAGGIDLTSFGIGTGPVDYVQSIYFRLFTRAAHSEEAVVWGTVTFPAETRILGFITDPAALGSSTSGPAYEASDALFAVSPNPSDYAVGTRGFETGGGPAASEFICQISDNSFAFALDVTTGVDDFRVILDYGSDYPVDTTFRIDLSEESFNGVAASAGVILGEPTGGIAVGAGDYGEVVRLAHIPLTARMIPAPGVSPAPDATTIFLARETGIDPRIDLLETRFGAFVPGEIGVPVGWLYSPRAVVPGEDGLLYVLGDETDLVSVDPVSGLSTPIFIPDLPGVNIRMASRAGDPRLFILRETSWPQPEDAWVDVWNPVTSTFTGNFATFPTGYLANPVDLFASPDGTLYALGRSTGFHQISPVNGSVRTHVWQLPDLAGDYRRAAADPLSSQVYLLRDTTGPTLIDQIDTDTGTFTPAAASLSSPPLMDAGPMVVDNDRRLWVFGKNGGAAALDLPNLSGPLLWQSICLDLPGTTNHANVPRLPRETSPAGSARPLTIAKTPDPSVLTLNWESMDSQGLAYNLYQGTLGEFYSHVPIACHLASTPGAPGGTSFDVPTPAGDAYWFVTASDSEREGSAGPRPAAGAAPACGPKP